MVVSGIKSDYDSDNEPDIEYTNDVSESDAASDQLDDFIDGIF